MLEGNTRVSQWSRIKEKNKFFFMENLVKRASFGIKDFESLNLMNTNQLVENMPLIKPPKQICDTSKLRKQHMIPFFIGDVEKASKKL